VQRNLSLNSRVIHSGFHENPGTLKASLALEGSARMTQYAEERGIRFLKTGMLIAVPHGSIRSGLWQKRARFGIFGGKAAATVFVFSFA
jgi:hypothetical protein